MQRTLGGQKMKGGSMKKIILVVLLCLIMVGVVDAQVKVKDTSFGTFNITVAPYMDIGTSFNSTPNPIARGGIRIDLNNVYYGLGFYLMVEGGTIDVEDTNISTLCTQPNGCSWPRDFVDRWENSESYTSVRIGTQWPIKVFEK